MFEMNQIQGFREILGKCLKSGDEYRESPPKGPPKEYGVLDDAAQEAIDHEENGEDSTADRGKVYAKIALAEGESGAPLPISFPNTDDLADIHVCGIDGSNQRVQRSAFNFILARSSIVVFRYSSTGEKPYFKQHARNASAVVWVDGNIFDNRLINVHTTKPSSQTEEGKVGNMLDDLRGDNRRPLIIRYERGKMKKSPGGYSLGLAVQIHQALELLSISDAPKGAAKMICIKDGPLFSTSTTIGDTITGLSPIFSWEKGQVLIACSKRVGGSPLLLEALLNPNIGSTLKKIWFPNEVVLDSTLNQMSSDAILLPRLLKPGHRTPLMEAVAISRSGVVKEKKALTPLSCYYLSRNRPYTYIRMEVPLFQWENDREGVEKAIQIAAWQHDLGRSAPLVQLEADNQCDLSAEAEILRYQTASALFENNLNLLEDYDDE